MISFQQTYLSTAPASDSREPKKKQDDQKHITSPSKEPCDTHANAPRHSQSNHHDPQTFTQGATPWHSTRKETRAEFGYKNLPPKKQPHLRFADGARPRSDEGIKDLQHLEQVVPEEASKRDLSRAFVINTRNGENMMRMCALS